LEIQLLIGFVDERDPVVGQTKRATAIFVHATAHTEPGGVRHFVTPSRQCQIRAGSVLRAIFVPEQAGGRPAARQIDAGGDGLVALKVSAFGDEA
jgi:hypothetical protein